MSNSYNKVFLLGRLGHDPKVAATQTGRTVTTLDLATSEYSGKGDDRKEYTTWHKIICWDKLGEVAGNYLKKGAKIHVEGRITNRKYEAKDGQEKKVTEIVAVNLIFLDSKNGNQSHDPGPADPYAGQNSNYQPATDDPDGVPF